MAADRVLCSKPCSLQNADKSYTDGTFYVYNSLARFMARGGSGQKLELEINDVTGQKRSKTNPLLMLETTKKGKPVLKFNTQDDREAVSAAITQAQEALSRAGQPAAAGAAAAAGPAGAVHKAAAAAAGGAKPASLQGVKLTQEQKQLLLANNKAIAAQHKALVLDSSALSDDEFWGSGAVQRAAGLVGGPAPTARSSRRGLANKLVDLARQNKTTADGKLAQLTMSAEDEQQLLAEKPALRAVYDAQVGHTLSRAEFWEKYFMYYMAKRGKREAAAGRYKALQQSLAAGSAAAVADMGGQAGEAAQLEDREMTALFSSLDGGSTIDPDTRASLKRKLNPLLDLSAAAGDSMTGEGYGLAHNTARSEADVVQGYSGLSQQLAQDYNVHSAAVMGQQPQRPPPPPAAAAAAGGADGPNSSTTPPQVAASSSAAAAAAAAAGAGTGSSVGLVAGGEMSEEQARQYRQQAGIVLEDLQAPPQQQFEELRVTHPRLYFRASQQQQQQPGQQQQQQSLKQEKQQQDIVSLLGSIDPLNLLDPPMASGTAKQVLHELAGGDLSAAAGGRGGPASLPQQHLDFVQQQSMVIDELLRHFWSLIPVNTDEKIAKFKRIQKSMDSCYEVLNRLLGGCEAAHKAPLTRLVKPLWEQLDLNIGNAKSVERTLQQRGLVGQRQQQQQQRQQ